MCSTHSLHIRISQSTLTRQVTHRIFLSSISAIAQVVLRKMQVRVYKKLIKGVSF